MLDFTRMDDDESNEEQDEETLFDNNKRRGVNSELKAGKRSSSPGSDAVDDISASGACSRWMVTFVLCASFLGLGMCISVLGPTFEDLAINVNQDVSNISFIFVGRSMGYIGGSVLGGILYDRMNAHLLLGLSMLVTAIGMFAIPFCKKALLLTAMMYCIGISLGILGTGGNVQILNTWSQQAGPHMQALHFSFAAGAFASPIIAKMIFGTGRDLEMYPPTNTSMSVLMTSSPVTDQQVSKAPSSTTFRHFINSTLMSMWAYIVIGFFILLVSFLFFILYARSTASQGKARTRSGKPLLSKHHKALIALLFIFFFFYVGVEVTFGSFIFLFGKDHANMDQPQAAGLNSLFWGTFAGGRGLAIFFAACMHPGTMIVLSLVGSTLSALFLTIFSRELVVLWVCTGTYGLSMATVFPSAISWMEQYTTVTGYSAAVFVLGAAVGEMVLPAFLGFMLGRNPQDLPILMYATLATSIVTCILFPIMYKLATASNGPGRKPCGRGRPKADDREYLQALLDEQEEQQEDEADQERCSLLTSPNKTFSSPPDVAAGSSGNTTGQAPSVLSMAQSTAPPGGAFLSDSEHRRCSLHREKRD